MRKVRRHIMNGMPLLIANNILYVLFLALAIVFAGRDFSLITLFPAVCYASCIEYFIHRVLLHSIPAFPGRLHALHHEAFNAASMKFRNREQWDIILFSPGTTMAIISLAFGHLILLQKLGLPKVGVTVALVLTGYFFLYEWLHLAFHSRTAFTRGVWALRKWRHHHLKHHQKKGRSGNFNVVFPFADYCLRTLGYLVDR